MSHLPVQQPRLIRSLHHLACTGGTLISEVNPLNRNTDGFHPNNPLLLLEQGWRPLRHDQIREAFRADIDQAIRFSAEANCPVSIRLRRHPQRPHIDRRHQAPRNRRIRDRPLVHPGRTEPMEPGRSGYARGGLKDRGPSANGDEAACPDAIRKSSTIPAASHVNT